MNNIKLESNVKISFPIKKKMKFGGFGRKREEEKWQ
jgi:hypothetical protein